MFFEHHVLFSSVIEPEEDEQRQREEYDCDDSQWWKEDEEGKRLPRNDCVAGHSRTLVDRAFKFEVIDFLSLFSTSTETSTDAAR